MDFYVSIIKIYGLYEYKIRCIQLDLASERRLVEEFLAGRQLKLEPYEVVQFY